MSYTSNNIKEITDIILSGNIPFLMGAPGKSKSAIARKIAKDNGMKYYDIRLSQKDETEVGGLPCRVKKLVKQEDDNGEIYEKEIEVLTYALPQYFVECIENGHDGKPCLIHFEELNRSTNSVRNACLEILCERTLNGSKLPDNIYMIISGNLGAGEDNCEVEEMDAAVMNRIVPIKYDPQANDWLNEFGKENCMSIICNFIASDHEYLYYVKSFENSAKSVKQLATPRSWTNFNKYLKYKMKSRFGSDAEEYSLPKDDLLDLINSLNGSVCAGFIGDVPFSKFKDFALKYLDIDWISILTGKINNLENKLSKISLFHANSMVESFISSIGVTVEYDSLDKYSNDNFVLLFNCLSDDNKFNILEKIIAKFADDENLKYLKEPFLKGFLTNPSVAPFTKKIMARTKRNK